MAKRNHIKVKVNSERPDFRVFASYFFGEDLHSYDSEGDSFPVTSKKWTELYMGSRQESNLNFEICAISENPLVLVVSSKEPENAYRIAYFLARETNGEILDENNGIIPLRNLIKKMGNFNLQERLLLADQSIWRRATEENPYPNLNE